MSTVFPLTVRLNLGRRFHRFASTVVAFGCLIGFAAGNSAVAETTREPTLETTLDTALEKNVDTSLEKTINPLASRSQDPIRIGVPVSKTGRLAEFANQQLKGMQQFIADINNRGALLGRRVELVVRDDASTVSGARRAFQELMAQGISLFISPYSSELTLAIKDEVMAADVAMLTVASVPQIWDNVSVPKIFGLYTPADENMRPLLDLAQEKALRRVAILYQDSVFPAAVAAAVRRDAPTRGMQIVFDEAYPTANANYAALGAAVNASKPDVVVVGSYLEDAIEFSRQTPTLSTQLLAFSGGPALRAYGDAVGHQKAHGVLSTVQWMRSVRFPGSFDFGFRYQEKHGIYPSYDAAGGYAALQVLEAAVRLAGNVDPTAVRQHLSSMKFRSIIGHYRVDDAGRQTAKSTYLVQWQDSHISLVYPQELARYPLRYPFSGWR